ncbi:MAG TPA: hypothetical protein VLZ83_05320 [Edaphocola sp.]|nr:hypothetical protein [Edaphocola sp.]
MAYDYYPFGMLMHGRYTSDTNSRCLLVSRNTWTTTMVDSCYPAVQLTGTATTLGVATYNSPGGSTFAAAAPSATDAVVLNQTIASGIDNVLTFDVVDLKEGDEEGVLVTVLETIDNVPYVIGGGRLRQGKDQRISFRSTGNNIQVVLNGPYSNLILAQICTRYARSTAQTYLVEVCDESKDRYTFGYNGIEKVNEIAGIGNHYTALFGEYDPRRGRRWNLDPKPNISISPYSLYANNPILFSDPLLDTVIAEKSAQADIKSDLNKVYKKDFFEFNSNDELSFTVDGLKELNSIRNYSGKNKKRLAMRESLFGMETMINSTELTGINYSDDPLPINAIDPGTSNSLKNPTPSQLGGEFALTKQDLKGTTNSFSMMGRKLDNLVNVNPAPSTSQYVNASKIKNVTNEQLLQSIQHNGRVPFVNSRHNLLMHGLGHVLYQGANQQPNVIQFDNANRILSGDSHNDDSTGRHK